MSANEPTNRIVYVTRDIERALGVLPNDNYMIVSNKTSYSEKILKNLNNTNNSIGNNILLIENATILDTAELLEQNKVRDYINQNDSTVLVFKNTSLIEDIVKKNGWNLLNPPSTLAEKYENKITQVEWLGELAKYLPPHSISLAKNLKWSDQPIVVQWAHGHTGDGTILVNSQKELDTIQAKFPERLARATTFINGPSFTVNMVVAPNTILIGNISYQITGLPPFTDNRFSTIGNDWGKIVPALLNKSEVEYIHQIAREIGEKMHKDGWKGLFGIDIIKEEKTGKIFLIEINARQPASTTFESQLQSRYGGQTSVFEAHLLALQDIQIERPIIEIEEGAQIIQRVTKDITNISKSVIDSLESSGYNVIAYSNTEINSDLVRIHSNKGIISKHNQFNEAGEKIRACIIGK
ncbi:MAG: hypothetical protein WCW03_02145 [Candidatus Paceibacterota bacterium]|jgi:predicted ATP-grasp superfamily ATP-dependent carboligase